MRPGRIFFTREKYDEVIRRGELIFENNDFVPALCNTKFRARFDWLRIYRDPHK